MISKNVYLYDHIKIYVTKMQFIHTVNGEGSKTAKKIMKRHY